MARREHRAARGSFESGGVLTMDDRTENLLGSAAFFIVAPGTIAGVIPWLITHWRFGEDASFGVGAVGVMLILAGLAILTECFARFALKGRGTPAPIAAPKELVVTGFYAHVRNPMYVAVSLIVFGQSLLFANAALIAYGVVVWFAFLLFVLYYEEPRLKHEFPEAYEDYAAAVPRWIPRLKPWRPTAVTPQE
ncbi:MAG TPA: isoprenylcysteine carboxylmethyltransferase family protein [Vitreimonas sp.]|nr:isoprenylcysteine carboxylmethyltransferase family protein [Vitreimonas sp.]